MAEEARSPSCSSFVSVDEPPKPAPPSSLPQSGRFRGSVDGRRSTTQPGGGQTAIRQQGRRCSVQITDGLEQILPDFKPIDRKDGPIRAQLRSIKDVVLRFEARNHKRIQALPHTAPMLAACVCVVLMLLPIQPPKQTPQLFQVGVALTGIAAAGWLVVALGNDYAYFRIGLLPPQRRRTVIKIVLFGVVVGSMRIINWLPGINTSTEWLQRVLVGVPYFTFRFFGLDMWGYAVGVGVFFMFLTLGFFGLCLFNCCGRVRIVQSITRRRRDAMPFMDMVSNRFTLSLFNPLLFLYPFCILSSFVIGGSVLIGPWRSFAPTGPPSTMRMLCSPVVSTHIYSMAYDAVKEISLIPSQIVSSTQAHAVGTVLLDLAWRGTFEPLETECDAMVVAPVPVGYHEVSLPKVPIAIRDSNGLAAGVSDSALVYIQLIKQPSDSEDAVGQDKAAAAGVGGNQFEDLRRPWCNQQLHGPVGCAVSRPGCTSSARLAGVVSVRANKEHARAGIVVFDSLRLAVEDDGMLCDGDYELLATLHDSEGGAADDWHPGSNKTVELHALPPARLATLVNVRLVRSLHEDEIRTRHWSAEMPGYFNITDMTRSSSVVHYIEHAGLHTVRTIVTTNTTVVGFRWKVVNSTNSSSSGQTEFARAYGLPSHFHGLRVPEWPDPAVDPVVTTEEEVHTRPSAHLMSFLRAPPRAPVLLKHPFEVSLRLTTESGMSLPGEQIQAIVLAPIGSGVVLAPGAFGYTDEAGVATFNISIEEGESGDYMLLFGSNGTMQTAPREDVGSVLKAVKGVMDQWRNFVDPIAGSVASIASALTNGKLYEVLKARTEEAIRNEMRKVAEHVDSCLSLLNYTADQYEREQTIQAVFELKGTPSEGLASFFEDLALEEVVWANFQEERVAGENPEALLCYEQARTLGRTVPEVYADPKESLRAFSAALTQKILKDLGLDTLAGVVQTVEPHASDLDSHLRALNQSMALAQATYNHITNTNGEGNRWEALLRMGVLLAFGWGAPPATLVTLESGVGSVELTAPFSGYSLFASASTDPSRNEGGGDAASSACVQEGYTSYMPALRDDAELRGTSLIDRLGYAIKDSLRVITALPLASPLWQPPLFLSQNWLLDASKYGGTDSLIAKGSPWSGSSLPHMGRYSPLCATSFLTFGQILPGTAGAQPDPVDRDVTPVVVDPLFPRYELAAAIVESLGGRSESVTALCKGVGKTRTTIQLENRTWELDEEICGFATYLARHTFWRGDFGQAGNVSAASVNSSSVDTLYFSARPKLIVRAADGTPLAGRYCTVVDAAGDQWNDVLALRVSVDKCGPSNEQGEIEIEGLRIRGGATRELRLEARVEGSRAVLSPHTAWRDDMHLQYLSADQPTLQKLDLITLQGHDSVRLMALLALPLFALNGRSLRGKQPPHLVWRICAVAAFAFFLWISLAFFHRFVGPYGLDWAERRRTTLFLIAPSDIMPIRSATHETMPMILAGCSLALTIWLTIATFWLLLRHEREKVKRSVAKVKRRVVRAARRSIVGLANVVGARGPSIVQFGGDACTHGPTAVRGANGLHRRRARSRHEKLISCCRCILIGVQMFVKKTTTIALTVCLGRAQKARIIPEAQWIETSPGWWSESEATRRSRSARNHVRTMLRGRSAYTIYKKRQHKSFFYPQRLWMALTLSLWIQILLTLFFVNTVRWLAAALSAAEDFDEKVVAESQHHAAVDEVNRFAPMFRTVMLVVWAFLADNGRGTIVHSVLQGVGVGVPIVQSMILLLNWMHVFVLYRERVMRLRQGIYFFDRKIYREEYASLYIGYQVAGMTLSGFFFMAAGVLLAVPLTILITTLLTTEQGKLWFFDFTLSKVPSISWTLGSLVLTLTFQLIVNLCVFFDGPRGNKWLRHRFWYALYEYNMIFSNTLVGIAVMISRFVLWSSAGMFCLGRIDMTLLPGPGQLEFADFSYRCYIALVRQDHRYNNPICVVFFDILTDHLAMYRRSRARRLLRRHFRLTWQLGVALSALRDRTSDPHFDRGLLRKNVSKFIHIREEELDEERRNHQSNVRESHVSTADPRASQHDRASRYDSFASSCASRSDPRASRHGNQPLQILEKSASHASSIADVGPYARPSRAFATAQRSSSMDPTRFSLNRARSTLEDVLAAPIQKVFDHSHDPAEYVRRPSASSPRPRKASVFELRRMFEGSGEGPVAGSTLTSTRLDKGPFRNIRNSAVDMRRSTADVRRSIAHNLARVRARHSSKCLQEETDEPGGAIQLQEQREWEENAAADALDQRCSYQHRGTCHRRVISEPPSGLSALRTPGDPPFLAEESILADERNELQSASVESAPQIVLEGTKESDPYHAPKSEGGGEEKNMEEIIDTGNVAAIASGVNPAENDQDLETKETMKKAVSFSACVRSQRPSCATHGALGTSHDLVLWDDEEDFLSPLQALAAKQDHENCRRRLVRNRWQLFWMLHKHPVLQSYRAHALDVQYLRKKELQKKAKDAVGVSFWRRWQRLPQKAARQMTRARERVLRKLDQQLEPIDERALDDLDDESPGAPSHRSSNGYACSV